MTGEQKMLHAMYAWLYSLQRDERTHVFNMGKFELSEKVWEIAYQAGRVSASHAPVDELAATQSTLDGMVEQLEQIYAKYPHIADEMASGEIALAALDDQPDLTIAYMSGYARGKDAGRVLASQPIVIREAADRIEQLERENAELRSIFRVNMLRAFPGKSHEDISSEIDRAINAAASQPQEDSKP